MKLSRILNFALILASMSINKVYADANNQLLCMQGRYVMRVYNNPPGRPGEYTVLCVNDFRSEVRVINVPLYQYSDVWGTFGGNVECAVAGTTISTYSAYCPPY